MATPLYFPDVMSALPEPRFVEPQSNTGMMAMGSALQSLTSVANNFRAKEMNVQKANQMADALEREGLTQEANLYRSASQSYQTNFFATPQENEKFNQSLLNDTLKLLTNKQEREMKAQQLDAELEYKNAMIGNMRSDNIREGRKLTLDERIADIRENEQNEIILNKQDALLQKEQRNKMLGLNATADNLRQRAKQNQDAIEDLKKQRDIGALTQAEFAEKSSPYYNELNQTRRQLNTTEKTILQLNDINVPPDNYVDIDIPILKSKVERDAEVNARSVPYFAKYPDAKEYTEGNVTIMNPRFNRPNEVTTTRGTDANGNPINRIQETQYVQPGASGAGQRRDPTAPFAAPSQRY